MHHHRETSLLVSLDPKGEAALGAPLPMVYIFLSLFVLQECVLMLIISTTETFFLTAKLLKQGYRYHKIRKTFSKFYHKHSELIVKYNIGLKTLLQQGISEPIFYRI